jgi:hypothetical protein
MTPQTKEKIDGLIVRAGVLVFVFILGRAIFGFLEGERIGYWLKRDAQQGMATIAKERQHGVVDYKYSVDGQNYTGISQRNWDIEKYRYVGVGQESIVYYSSSHPWLSSLETPQFPTTGTIFLLMATPLECMLLFMAILPGPVLLHMVNQKK